MIYEKELTLTKDEKNTLLFLTSGMKLIKTKEITKEDLWNLKQYFGEEIPKNDKLIKVIIFRDKVVLRLWRN